MTVMEVIVVVATVLGVVWAWRNRGTVPPGTGETTNLGTWGTGPGDSGSHHHGGHHGGDGGGWGGGDGGGGGGDGGGGG